MQWEDDTTLRSRGVAIAVSATRYPGSPGLGGGNSAEQLSQDVLGLLGQGGNFYCCSSRSRAATIAYSTAIS
jgi:hypothetical protein